MDLLFVLNKSCQIRLKIFNKRNQMLLFIQQNKQIINIIRNKLIQILNRMQDY